ncbi:MAG: 16S rRNA (guanine527-N7)-methyltransferase [bacterium]
MSDLVTPRWQLELGIEFLQEQSIPAISEALIEPLVVFLELLVKWNRVYNLTAVRDPVEMVDRHLVESLIMNRWLPSVTQACDGVFDVMDIGSGAGLPVIPLAITRPDLSFVSIESNGKKCRFQQQATMELKLPNVHIINDRVENVSISAHMVLSRAFTAPEDFLRIAQPLCAKNGQVAIMLGHAKRFPAQLPDHYSLEEFVELSVPGTESARHVALCRRE